MLTLKIQTAQDFADQQLKKLQNQSQRRTFDINKLSKEDIESLVRDIKRPFDHKNRRPFHFITIEKDGKVFLFDGLNRFVKAFEIKEDESELYFHRRVRLYALAIFEKAERQTGGFLYNDSPITVQNIEGQSPINTGKIYDLLTLEKSAECEICDKTATNKIYLGGIMTKVCEICVMNYK